MTEQEIRLECLKLAHTFGLETGRVVERATEYETYVIGPKPEEPAEVIEAGPAVPPEAPKKTLTLSKADNPKRAG